MTTEPIGFLELEDEEGARYRWALMSEGDIDRVLDAIVNTIGDPQTVLA